MPPLPSSVATDTLALSRSRSLRHATLGFLRSLLGAGELRLDLLSPSYVGAGLLALCGMFRWAADLWLLLLQVNRALRAWQGGPVLGMAAWQFFAGNGGRADASTARRQAYYGIGVPARVAIVGIVAGALTLPFVGPIAIDDSLLKPSNSDFARLMTIAPFGRTQQLAVAATYALCALVIVVCLGIETTAAENVPDVSTVAPAYRYEQLGAEDAEGMAEGVPPPARRTMRAGAIERQSSVSFAWASKRRASVMPSAANALAYEESNAAAEQFEAPAEYHDYSLRVHFAVCVLLLRCIMMSLVCLEPPDMPMSGTNAQLHLLLGVVDDGQGVVTFLLFGTQQGILQALRRTLLALRSSRLLRLLCCSGASESESRRTNTAFDVLPGGGHSLSDHDYRRQAYRRQVGPVRPLESSAPWPSPSPRPLAASAALVPPLTHPPLPAAPPS